MPISRGDMVFSLIQSMTKAEKRNFKLYIRRLQKEGEVKFIRLFEILEKWEVYDEQKLREELKIETPHQLSNLKRNLYHHLLTSLRLIRINQGIDIQVRELINSADILYARGLYLQALKLLNKAKTKAKKHHQDLLHLEIIEFEKRIESRHITRSGDQRMAALINESGNRVKVSGNIVSWSNLKLELQRIFINDGHVKSELERKKIAHLYSYSFLDISLETMTFFEKAHFFQASYWLHYLLLELEQCRDIARKWVQLYRKDPQIIAEDVDSFLHALHCMLTAAYYLRDRHTFQEAHEQLEAFLLEQQEELNANSQIIAFLYRCLAQLNAYFLSNQLKESLQKLPELEANLNGYQNLLDPHKIHIFYYKIAWIYLANGQPGNAISYLQEIINHPTILRDDMRIYTRLQLILAHMDLKNRRIIDYLLDGTYRAIKKAKDTNPLQRLCIRYLKKLNRIAEAEQPAVLVMFKAECLALQENTFFRRAFLYLDIVPWLDSQLLQKNMVEL